MAQKLPKGCLEYNAEDQELIDKILSTTIEVYERFAYRHLDSSSLQDLGYLTEEGSLTKEIYKVSRHQEDSSKAKMGLRFDLTKPFARHISENNHSLPFPFKRWDYGRVYRGEKPQKGRLRQFYQCDFDVVNRGDLPLYYDFEVVQVIYEVMNALLGENTFDIRFNHRGLVNDLLKNYGIENDLQDLVYKLLDSFYKIDRRDFSQELEKLGLREFSDDLLACLESKVDSLESFERLKEMSLFSGLVDSEPLKAIEYYFKLGINAQLDLTIVRGLGYYTGFVVESFVDGNEGFGSVFSGGRYDNLVQSSDTIPGVGASIGISRIAQILKLRQTSEASLLFDDELVFISVLDDKKESILVALRLCSAINKKTNTLIDVPGKRLSKLIDAMKPRWLVSIINSNLILKDLKNKEVISRDLASTIATLQ